MGKVFWFINFSIGTTWDLDVCICNILWNGQYVLHVDRGDIAALWGSSWS
jgi:hypothetical protein